MDRKRPPWWRRRYIINRTFQFAFIGYTLGVAVFVIAIVYAANAYFFWHMIENAPGRGQYANPAFDNFVAAQRGIMTNIFLIASVVVALALSIFGVLFSHRIAGPIFRLTKHFNEMADGAPESTLTFRNGDFFQEVAIAFNRFLQRRRPPNS